MMRNFLQILLIVVASACGCTGTAGGAPSSEENRNEDEFSFDDYKRYARQLCDSENGSNEGTDIVLGYSNFSYYYGSMHFADEVGGPSMVYLTDTCELYTGQRCAIGLQSEEECTPFQWRQLPYTRTQLTSEEVAAVLYKVRAFEWEEQIEDGEVFQVADHDAFVVVQFNEHQFLASQIYRTEVPWEEENPDEDYWGPLLEEAHYLIHDGLGLRRPGGAFDSPMADIIARSEEFYSEQVRLMLTEVSPESAFVEGYSDEILDWPITQTPDALEVVGEDEDYCYGSSNAIAGEDAEALRRIIREVNRAPKGSRERATLVRFEDRLFIIQVRETLPFENDDGLIEGWWDRWGSPSSICVPF